MPGLPLGSRTTGIAIECSQCGHGTGHYDLSGDSEQLRCDECQRFVTKSGSYCADHDLHYKQLPGDGCPACAEEEHVRAQERQLQTRDRRVEPY